MRVRPWLVVATMAVVSGCSGSAGPAPTSQGGDEDPRSDGSASPSGATWTLAARHPVRPASTELHLRVTRVDCNDGVTGELVAPQVRATERRIVITSLVAAPTGSWPKGCAGNDVVPYRLSLDEPVGERVLFDGICLNPEYSTYDYCEPSGVRHVPDRGGID